MMEVSSTYPPNSSSEDLDLFKWTYQYVAPVNISISVPVLLCNGLVISYFYRNCKKLTPLLFFLIALSDVVTALGHVLFDSAALMYTKGRKTVDDDVIMILFFVVYRILALGGNSCSVFLNVLLAVLRTEKVVDPFRRTNVALVKVAGAVWGLLLFALTLRDCISIVALKWTAVLFMMFDKTENPLVGAINYPGQTLPWTSDYHKNSQEIILLCVFYLLPVLTVFISMVVQLTNTARMCCTCVNNEDRVLTTDWVHVNTTVFLLALVFLISNSTTSVSALLVSGKYFKEHFRNLMIILTVLSTTLPLLNALLSPLIIITRSRNMRAYVVSRMSRSSDVDVVETERNNLES